MQTAQRTGGANAHARSGAGTSEREGMHRGSLQPAAALKGEVVQCRYPLCVCVCVRYTGNKRLKNRLIGVLCVLYVRCSGILGCYECGIVFEGSDVCFFVCVDGPRIPRLGLG